MGTDPENWVLDNFQTWRDRGCHHTAASYAALLAVSLAGTTNTTISTATTTAVAPQIKAAEDAWLNWQ